ncbi:hypothetical protein [Vibrio harveyi]|uniref:hypothetical protein n=1 Tax=Vibrio harveyi TaxID=669 RepID=UPI003CF093A5
MKKLLLCFACYASFSVNAGDLASKPFKIDEPQLIMCQSKFNLLGSGISNGQTLTVRIKSNELKVTEASAGQDFIKIYSEPNIIKGPFGDYKITGHLYEKWLNDGSISSPIYREAYINVRPNSDGLIVSYSSIQKAKYNQTGEKWYTDYVSQNTYLNCESTLPEGE